MKRTLLVAVTLLVVPAVLFADEVARPYLVGTRRAPREAMSAILNDDLEPRAGRRLVSFDLVNAFATDLTSSEVAALRRSVNVRYVEPDLERHITQFDSTPAGNETRNTAGQTIPYGVKLVNAMSVWPASRGKAINVAVLDTGIDLTHPDLKTAYAGGFNAYFPDTAGETADPIDDVGHGTHVAGTIAASDNDIGVVGVAPGVRLWSVRVLRNGSGQVSSIVKGIQFVVQQKQTLGGDWIISMSLGSCGSSLTERAALQTAMDAGILVIAASGNHDPTKPDDCSANNAYAVAFPGAYPGVVAVAAVDSTSKIADFSNFGPEVTVAAPGVDVLSTVRVGSSSMSFIQNGTTKTSASAITGSGLGTIAGNLVDCGLGKPGQCPASVAGNIALIKRGGDTAAGFTGTFNEKTRNALAQGASAVVIYNKDTSALNFTLISQTCDANGANCVDSPADLAFKWPVTIAITLADGQTLQSQAPSPTVSITNQVDDYGNLNGTSMATPHVSAVAALVWSVVPNATVADVKHALTTTSHDLGNVGVDNLYGYGLVDAYAAARLLAQGPLTGRRLLRR